MTDRAALFEATLESMPDGVGLLGQEGLVAYWNPAAEAITGFPSIDLVGRPLPEVLEPLVHYTPPSPSERTVVDQVDRLERGSLAIVRHKLGHDVPVMARITVLRDGFGGRIGTALVFHPTESLDALPRGDAGEDRDVRASQTEIEDRLQRIFDDFAHGGPAFGVLWIAVDQAPDLRKTHGIGACETMLDKIQRALAKGLRPGEEMGRWGQDEFLIISHERTAELLAKHAATLAGLARTADFRWWGDRVSLTVSIGSAQSEASGTLVNLLERAKAAMFSSFQEGGNQTTSAPGGQTCSPS
jgi:diguanylate cyclase (GGDEF)-like protein/PAS domain S-box-containing protein